jgi:hypothetical protein
MREKTLISRYRTVKAYGSKLEAALPNAREVGLAAYSAIRATFDAKICRCSRILRAIEGEMQDA